VADNKEVLVLNSPSGYPVPCALLPPPHLPSSFDNEKKRLHPSLEGRGNVVVVGDVCAGILSSAEG